MDKENMINLGLFNIESRIYKHCHLKQIFIKRVH